MCIIIACIFTSIVTSLITAKIMATHYYKIVDDHIVDMCDMTKEFVYKNIKSLHKYEQNSFPKE